MCKTDKLAGAFTDLTAVREGLRGAYGAWVNTDGFTVSERTEVYLGIRIFELANEVGTVRHFVYSSIDSAYKVRCTCRPQIRDRQDGPVTGNRIQPEVQVRPRRR